MTTYKIKNKLTGKYYCLDALGWVTTPTAHSAINIREECDKLIQDFVEMGEGTTDDYVIE